MTQICASRQPHPLPNISASCLLPSGQHSRDVRHPGCAGPPCWPTPGPPPRQHAPCQLLCILTPQLGRPVPAGLAAASTQHIWTWLSSCSSTINPQLQSQLQLLSHSQSISNSFHLDLRNVSPLPSPPQPQLPLRPSSSFANSLQ